MCHIEFGKFGLNVAVLCSTSDRAKKVSPDSNVARSIMANGFAIFGIIAKLSSIILLPAVLARATQLFAIIVTRSGNAVHILVISHALPLLEIVSAGDIRSGQLT